MPHPYEAHVGLPIWEAIDTAVRELERNDDLEIRTRREYVIGSLCERLSNGHLLTEAARRPANVTRDGLAAFLDRLATGSAESTDVQEALVTHYPDPEVEEARQRASLTLVRIQQGTLSQVEGSDFLRRLANDLRDGAS